MARAGERHESEATRADDVGAEDGGHSMALVREGMDCGASSHVRQGKMSGVPSRLRSARGAERGGVVCVETARLGAD